MILAYWWCERLMVIWGVWWIDWCVTCWSDVSIVPSDVSMPVVNCSCGKVISLVVSSFMPLVALIVYDESIVWNLIIKRAYNK